MMSKEELGMLYAGIRRLVGKADPDFRRVVEYIEHLLEEDERILKDSGDDRAMIRAQGSVQRLEKLCELLQNPPEAPDTLRQGRSF